MRHRLLFKKWEYAWLSLWNSATFVCGWWICRCKTNRLGSIITADCHRCHRGIGIFDLQWMERSVSSSLERSVSLPSGRSILMKLMFIVIVDVVVVIQQHFALHFDAMSLAISRWMRQSLLSEAMLCLSIALCMVMWRGQPVHCTTGVGPPIDSW